MTFKEELIATFCTKGDIITTQVSSCCRLVNMTGNVVYYNGQPLYVFHQWRNYINGAKLNWLGRRLFL